MKLPSDPTYHELSAYGHRLEREAEVAKNIEGIPPLHVLLADFQEAQEALAASDRALCTHGHQRITWTLHAYDGRRVRELRDEIAFMTNAEPEDAALA